MRYYFINLIFNLKSLQNPGSTKAKLAVSKPSTKVAFHSLQVILFKNIIIFLINFPNLVRGAGHMVPQKKGFEILHAIESFMEDKNFR